MYKAFQLPSMSEQCSKNSSDTSCHNCNVDTSTRRLQTALRVENMAWRMFSGGSRGKSVSPEALEEGLFLWSLQRRVCFSGASRGRSASPEPSGALQKKVHFSGA